MKLAAARLDALPLLGRDFLRAQVAIEQSLRAALPEVAPDRPARGLARHPQARARLQAAPPDHARAADRARAHEHRAARACRAGASRSSRSCSTPSAAPQVMVVTFIALLELAREHLLEVTQAEAFAPIYVRLAYQADAERRAGAGRCAQSTARTSRPPRPSTPAGRPQRSQLRDRVAGDHLDRHRRASRARGASPSPRASGDRVLARRAHDDVMDVEAPRGTADLLGALARRPVLLVRHAGVGQERDRRSPSPRRRGRAASPRGRRG